MSGRQEAEVLAERYLDLWERELAALAAGPAGPNGLAALVIAASQAVFGAANEESPHAGLGKADSDE